MERAAALRLSPDRMTSSRMSIFGQDILLG
jgi:hypothetical protein